MDPLGCCVARCLRGHTVRHNDSFWFGKNKHHLQKDPWNYAGNFTADKAASRINAANNVIPAQIFSVPKNLTQLFPASGHQNVSLKAQGTITIYNAYSSSPQSLVATTRFVTPAGKVFRLVNAVVVPGAAVTNGVIVPSSIDAAIIADQAGPDYNVSSTPKLTIPGFSGTPKYNAFYGVLASSTSGGYIGEKAVPTAADIAAAKQDVTSSLMIGLAGRSPGSYTNNFKILPGATTMQITKLTVNTSTDANGGSVCYGEGTLSAIGFDEIAFKAFLLFLAQSDRSKFDLHALSRRSAMRAQPRISRMARLGFSSMPRNRSSRRFRRMISARRSPVRRSAMRKTTFPPSQNFRKAPSRCRPAWLWQIPGNLTKKIQMTID